MKIYRRPGLLKKFIRVFWRNLPELYGFKIPFDAKSDESIVFIIGSGRSGTTILKNELSRKYKISFPIEMPALGVMIRGYYLWRLCNPTANISKAKEYFKRSLVRHYDVDVHTRDREGHEKIYNVLEYYDLKNIKLDCLNESSGFGFSILYIKLLREILDKEGVDEAIGDKTPWNTFHLTKIVKNFPNAKFIHIVRDGREVAVSYKDSLGELMNLSVTDGALRWRDSLRKVESSRKDIGNRLLEVRYEDFITDTDRVLANIARFLRVEPRRAAVDVVDLDIDIQQHQNLNKEISGASRNTKSSLISLNIEDAKRLRKFLLQYGYIDE